MSRPTSEQIADWYPRLFRTALRLTGSYQDAADMTQQAFTKALASWGSFGHRSSRTTWLYRILINCIRDWSRRNAIRAGVPLSESHLCIAAPNSPAGLQPLESKEQQAALRAAIEALAPPVRHAFVMTVFDGYSYQQAADALAVPVGTIASRVHEARSRLRKEFRDTFCGA